MKQGQTWRSQSIQLATKSTTVFFSKQLESESQALPANTFAVLTTVVKGRLYMTKQHIRKRRNIKLNEKIKLANEQLLKKDQRKCCTAYQPGMLGPHVPNVVDDEKSDWEEQSKVNENSTKEKKMENISSVCKLCHLQGHKRQYLGKCLLSTNLTSMYYKPENVGSQHSLCTCGFV
jgi:hypothetical protein